MRVTNALFKCLYCYQVILQARLLGDDDDPQSDEVCFRNFINVEPFACAKM